MEDFQPCFSPGCSRLQSSQSFENFVKKNTLLSFYTDSCAFEQALIWGMQESHPFPVHSLFFKTLSNFEESQVRIKPSPFKRALADRLRAQVMCWINSELSWQPPLFFFFIQEKMALSVKVPSHSPPWLLFRGLIALRSNSWAGPGISSVTDPPCSLMLFIQLWVYQRLVSPSLLWGFWQKTAPSILHEAISSDSGISALLFCSQEMQFSVLMFFCPFPLISESSWSSFSRFCFAVHNRSPAPRSHQIGSVPCSYHRQFLSDLKVKK